MSLRECLDDLLVCGLDDWIQAAEIASVARTIGAAVTEVEVRDLSLRLVRELIGQDLMEVGAVTESGFTSWEISVDQALRRIEQEWRALPKGPDLGDVCWLNLTKKGEVQAKEVWSRRNQTPGP